MHFRSEHPLHYDLVEVGPVEEKLTAEQAIIISLGKTPKTPQQIAEETGCNLKSVRNTIVKLATTGAAKVQGKLNGTIAYTSA